MRGYKVKFKPQKQIRLKEKKFILARQHHTTTTEDERKAFHSKKQNTEIIFDPRRTNEKFLNDSADKETFTASQAKKKL